MTTRRLIASVTFSAAALSVVAILATRAFPLEAQAPKASPAGLQGGPVEIARGGEHLLHGSLPSYPRRAIEQRVEGEVVLDVSIDERGEVTDARVTSGPEELRRAALEAVLQWHYASDKVRSTSSQVALRFRVPAKSEPQKFEAVVKQEGESKRYTLTLRPHLTKERIAASLGMELQLATLAKALDDPALDQDRRAELEQKRETMRRKLEESRRLDETRDLAVDIHEAVPVLTRIKADGLPASFVRQIETAAGIKVGEPLTKEVMERVAEVVRSLDEHLLVRVQPVPGGGVMLVLIAP